MPKTTFVDEEDNIIGYGTRTEALEKGIIYRIVQIFLFNSKRQLLIQKRSKNVRGGGKWDQSAGGRVDEGENYNEAARRELKEELGITSVPLREVT
ncbi:MAG: NUDIX domain-containing protein, partial [bacterium]|nr:NUDIX domain-containing protein [bacterium]